MKQLLSAMVAACLVSQGIARADEPGRSVETTTVRDRTVLVAPIERLSEADRIAATDRGSVAREPVDKDADDVVIDQPLVSGGAERIAIPRRETQSLRYQPGVVPHATPMPWKTAAILAAVTAVGVLVASLVSKSFQR